MATLPKLGKFVVGVAQGALVTSVVVSHIRVGRIETDVNLLFNEQRQLEYALHASREKAVVCRQDIASLSEEVDKLRKFVAAKKT